MQNSELSVENLQAKIEAAFSDVKPPLSENIIEHECQECRDVERTFRNQNWRNIEPKKVEWAYDKLPLFTPEAFHYFLPAFMLYSTQEPNSEVCEFVVFALASKKASEEWWQERLDKFTTVQKAACNLFLRWLLPNPEYVCDSKDMEKALKTWWKEEAF
jgi:hypothetical protein